MRRMHARHYVAAPNRRRGEIKRASCGIEFGVMHANAMPQSILKIAHGPFILIRFIRVAATNYEFSY